MLPRIPGVLAAKPQAAQLRNIVANLMGSRGTGFPGAQPISFARDHIHELQRENYFVSEKADGIRCLMFSTTDSNGRGETYLIDRHNEYYRLDFGLPIPGRRGAFHYDTILDGELVLDVYPDQKQVLWFLLFDCMAVDGKSLVERDYMKRLGYLKETILKPYKELMSQDKNYAAVQPFRMDLKPLQLSYHLQKVFEDIPNLKHKSDGIIFTSSVARYYTGTCEKMLKWKPANENTVDFRIRVVGDFSQPEYALELWEGRDEYSEFGMLTLEPELEQSWARSPPENRIIECRYDPSWPGQWRFSRWRDDKQHANHRSTYRKIMESIRDGVDEQELLNSAPLIRSKWKDREREAATGRV
ncbi:putative mRNA capping enzyme alpha subunit [Fimicolochytrium jonesii]|uniref:putative mRNA capping enzyme alpha subunit n=1 Tax=Fimicolochytrium jonesii TaxID=1396493 RepID=UPI0022FEF2A6|nr:putative mRNA capping enzyme alpha subunit [Fimicolochytrium jonesii]KAI8816620.1 putative mRNA capping enzyme alpha subunit [Fimicolochytrium jonesii]